MYVLICSPSLRTWVHEASSATNLSNLALKLTIFYRLGFCVVMLTVKLVKYYYGVIRVCIVFI